MKNKSIAWGIFLIIMASYYLCYQMDLIPEEFSTIKVLLSIVCVFGIIHGLINRSMIEVLCVLAVLLSLYASLLGIEKIAGFPIILGFCVIGFGLDLLIGDHWKKKNKYNNPPQFGNPYVENVADGEQIFVKNLFGQTNKYVNSNSFRYAKIANQFGKCVVYFNNAVLAGATAHVDAENHFGELSLYFPNTWRVDVQRDASFGDVKFFGMGSSNPDAPVVTVHADVSFGEINIHFE